MSKREYDEIRDLGGGWTLSKRHVPDLDGTEYRLDAPQWVNASYIPDERETGGLHAEDVAVAAMRAMRESLIYQILADEHVRAAIEKEFARRLGVERWRSFQ